MADDTEIWIQHQNWLKSQQDKKPQEKTDPQSDKDKPDDAKKPEDKDSEQGWQSLDSSNLSSYKYDKHNRSLGIIFRGGRLYTFTGVDEKVATGLGKAGSPGRYFNSQIKNKFGFSQGGRAK